MKKYILIASTLTLFGITSVEAKSPLYFGGEIGYVDQGLDNMHLFDDGINYTDSYDKIDSLDALSLGILSGYKFDHGIRLEGKYNYILSENDSFVDNVIGINHISIETEIHKMTGSLYYDYDLSDSFSIYTGGGLGFSYVRVPTSLWNSGTWGYKDKADSSFQFTWELSLGLAYTISETTDITFQYTYSDLGNFVWQNTGNDGLGGSEDFAGDADLTLSSFALGIRYHF